MPAKKNVVLKANLNATDKENVINFDKVVTSIVKSKLDTIGTRSGSRQLVKITAGLKIKVAISVVEDKVKVVYKINGEAYIDKEFGDLASFESAIAEMEEKL